MAPPNEFAKFHPIIAFIFTVATKSPTERFILEENAVRLIKTELKKLYGTFELQTALQDLVKLAATIDLQYHCPTAAQKLIRIFHQTEPELQKLKKLKK